MISIWSKFCLIQEVTTLGKSITTQLPHVLASKNKAGYVLKNIMKAAHDKVSKSSPKHTFLRGTRREKKQQPTWCVYYEH